MHLFHAAFNHFSFNDCFRGEEGKPMGEYVGKNGKAYETLKQNPSTKVIIDGSSSTFAFYW